MGIPRLYSHLQAFGVVREVRGQHVEDFRRYVKKGFL